MEERYCKHAQHTLGRVLKRMLRHVPEMMHAGGMFYNFGCFS